MFLSRRFTVKIISHPDNSTSFEVIESQLENPLIDADHQDLDALKTLPWPGPHHRSFHKRNHTGDDDGKFELVVFVIPRINRVPAHIAQNIAETCQKYFQLH